MVYGGGGTPTRLVCGFVGSPVRRHPLLDALPMTLTLDTSTSRANPTPQPMKREPETI